MAFAVGTSDPVRAGRRQQCGAFRQTSRPADGKEPPRSVDARRTHDCLYTGLVFELTFINFGLGRELAGPHKVRLDQGLMG